MKLADVREEGTESWMEPENAEGFSIDLFHDIGSTSGHLCTDKHTQKSPHPKPGTIIKKKTKNNTTSPMSPLAVRSSVP